MYTQERFVNTPFFNSLKLRETKNRKAVNQDKFRASKYGRIFVGNIKPKEGHGKITGLSNVLINMSSDFIYAKIINHWDNVLYS